MSEKIQRYHINERCIVVPNRFGALCQSSDVSALESRLAEAEKERDRLVAENDRLRQDRYDALSVTSKDGLLASEWVARTGKAERESKALSARIRELEEANDRAFETCARIVEKDYLDDHYNERDKAQFTLNVARDRIAKKIRAARALKGTT